MLLSDMARASNTKIEFECSDALWLVTQWKITWFTDDRHCCHQSFTLCLNTFIFHMTITRKFAKEVTDDALLIYHHSIKFIFILHSCILTHKNVKFKAIHLRSSAINLWQIKAEQQQKDESLCCDVEFIQNLSSFLNFLFTTSIHLVDHIADWLVQTEYAINFIKCCMLKLLQKLSNSLVSADYLTQNFQINILKSDLCCFTINLTSVKLTLNFDVFHCCSSSCTSWTHKSFKLMLTNSSTSVSASNWMSFSNKRKRSINSTSLAVPERRSRSQNHQWSSRNWFKI